MRLATATPPVRMPRLRRPPRRTGIAVSRVDSLRARAPPWRTSHRSVVGSDRDWVGRRVAVTPLLSCGRCERCRAGERNLCADRRLIGVHVPGGFAELVAVPVTSLVPLPDGIDPRTGALVEPLANAVHAIGLGRRLVAADIAVVLGAGTIGVFAVHAARAAGIPDVRVVEPHAARRES